MCLISKNWKGYIAEEDIVCYKFVELIGFKDGIAQFATPFCKYPVRVNKMLIAEGKISEPRNYIGGDLVIEQGIIHCYQSIYFAETWNTYEGCILLKCIIPAGEVFYINKDGGGQLEHEIGAKKIYVTDEVISYNSLFDKLSSKTLDKVAYHAVGESHQLRIPFNYKEIDEFAEVAMVVQGHY